MAVVLVGFSERRESCVVGLLVSNVADQPLRFLTSEGLLEVTRVPISDRSSLIPGCSYRLQFRHLSLEVLRSAEAARPVPLDLSTITEITSTRGGRDILLDPDEKTPDGWPRKSGAPNVIYE
jgi:hypothetical protein